MGKASGPLSRKPSQRGAVVRFTKPARPGDRLSVSGQDLSQFYMDGGNANSVASKVVRAHYPHGRFARTHVYPRRLVRIQFNFDLGAPGPLRGTGVKVADCRLPPHPPRIAAALQNEP